MERILTRELLDFLPPDSAEAVGSRRDLVWINAAMGNARLAAREIQRALPKRGSILMADIGGGDGRFMTQVARMLGRRQLELRAQVIDRHPPPAMARHPASIAHVTADVFAWAAETEPRFDVILANLFLHHFTSEQLRNLFANLERRTEAFIAIEPERNSLSLLLTRALWMLGCNRVTRHDAYASVRAGFRGSEMSSLWPAHPRWKLRESLAGFASHLFVATKS